MSECNKEHGGLMFLIEVRNGASIRIVSFQTGAGLAAKLRQLGLVPGDIAQVIRHAPFRGPILLDINGREIALGRNIAAKIKVEVVECDLP
jgi:ferrous iron transport protein A